MAKKKKPAEFDPEKHVFVPATAGLVRDCLPQMMLRGDLHLGYFKMVVDVDDEFDAKLKALTEAENEIFRLLLQGITYEEMAASRNSSVNTIKTQVKTVYRKLEVRNIEEAIRTKMKFLKEPVLERVFSNAEAAKLVKKK